MCAFILKEFNARKYQLRSRRTFTRLFSRANVFKQLDYHIFFGFIVCRNSNHCIWLHGNNMVWEVRQSQNKVGWCIIANCQIFIYYIILVLSIIHYEITKSVLFFRTLINQMNSTVSCIIVVYCILVGLPDLFRYIMGPYDVRFCEFIQFVRVSLWTMAFLILGVIISIRYIFIFK